MWITTAESAVGVMFVECEMLSRKNRSSVTSIRGFRNGLSYHPDNVHKCLARCFARFPHCKYNKRTLFS